MSSRVGVLLEGFLLGLPPAPDDEFLVVGDTRLNLSHWRRVWEARRRRRQAEELRATMAAHVTSVLQRDRDAHGVLDLLEQGRV